jgi:hypothetical protein
MRLSDPTCVLGRIVERLAAKNGLCAPSLSLVAALALGQIHTGARKSSTQGSRLRTRYPPCYI